MVDGLMELPFTLLVVFGIKWSAYSAWCWLGVGLLGRSTGARWPRAAGLGLLRLAVGSLLGFGLALLVSGALPTEGRVGIRLDVFLPAWAALRWVEWSLIASVIQRRWDRAFWLGSRRGDGLWRLGGLGVSFGTDFAALLAGLALYGMPC